MQFFLSGFDQHKIKWKEATLYKNKIRHLFSEHQSVSTNVLFPQKLKFCLNRNIIKRHQENLNTSNMLCQSSLQAQHRNYISINTWWEKIFSHLVRIIQKLRLQSKKQNHLDNNNIHIYVHMFQLHQNLKVNSLDFPTMSCYSIN